ncbi:YhgE/Pip domain-containing protein [Lentilactobacillus rapi]|nr:ABC transporter permease [Lentilactobacillus rapi]
MTKWFTNKFSWLGLLIASFISLSFLFCALPAFKQMPTNAKNLPVVIVNQDNQQISNKVTTGLKDNLPFKHVTTSTDLAGTKQRIKDRKASLAVVIPAGFNKDVRAGKQPTLNFVVNNANSMLQTNVNQSLISRVQSTVNAQLTHQSLVGMYAKQLAPKMMKTAMQAG